MTRQKLILLIIATTYFCCDNFNNKVNEHIDSSIQEAKSEMGLEVSNSKAAFNETYQKIMRKFTDSVIIKKITTLYFQVNETSKYIDSLRTKLNQLDDKDMKNIDLLKRLFINEGLGDSVVKKVILVYAFAIDVALSDSTKSRLIKAKDTYTADTKGKFFAMNGPLGVNMILYGIETELINDGTRSLCGYETK